eukprot:TRINITY_DN5286_c0_g2_i9.p3 TRINITY_DN5286_c0_g2~~TRINITY_DN5286_c0_g2_i9.p3  ORF type:complete len:102 (+),score=9.44 TRINITY_DN5286_c0_g2_i9:102-407(+)
MQRGLVGSEMCIRDRLLRCLGDDQIEILLSSDQEFRIGRADPHKAEVIQRIYFADSGPGFFAISTRLPAIEKLLSSPLESPLASDLLCTLDCNTFLFSSSV